MLGKEGDYLIKFLILFFVSNTIFNLKEKKTMVDNNTTKCEILK